MKIETKVILGNDMSYYSNARDFTDEIQAACDKGFYVAKLERMNDTSAVAILEREIP